MSPYGERVAAMEVEVKELKAELIEHKDLTAASFREVNRKLDTLIALRNKGAGIFWFISGIIATLGALYELLHWSR